MTVDLPSIPLCPFRAITGLDCPLCGATRATFALFDGDLSRALDLNPVYVLLLPVLAVVAVFWWRTRRMPAWVASPIAVRSAVVAALAYMVVRNLPFEPFSYLGT